jgi:hypothetical protein
VSQHVHARDGTFLLRKDGSPSRKFPRCACGAVQFHIGTKWLCPVLTSGIVFDDESECLEVLPCHQHGDWPAAVEESA